MVWGGLMLAYRPVLKAEGANLEPLVAALDLMIRHAIESMNCTGNER